MRGIRSMGRGAHMRRMKAHTHTSSSLSKYLVQLYLYLVLFCNIQVKCFLTTLVMCLPWDIKY